MIAGIVSRMAQNKNYIIPEQLKAHAYPAHVELNMQNKVGFIYEIYRSTDNGKTFINVGKSSPIFSIERSVYQSCYTNSNYYLNGQNY
jgi:hypothetical protein